MKVLFSITYFYPYVSGLTIAAERFALALVRAKHTIAVLCMLHDKTLGEIGKIGRIRVVRAKPLLRLSKGFVSWDWVVQSRKLVKEHDVIVINLPQFEGWITALFARLHGKRVVAIYHCEVVLPDGFLNSVVQSLLEVANMITLLVADKVVTYTADYARSSKVLRSFMSLKQGTTIHHIVPPIPVPRVSKAMVQKFMQKTGHPAHVIGVSARLAREKGIEYLLRAIPKIAKKVKDIKIIIAGPLTPVGEESYNREIMRLVKKYKKYVIFLGEVPHKEIGSFYALCDVLVLPSVNRTEAFGMVQVEAMLCGVPVVASNLPGVRMPVRKTGMGILVPVGDSEKLAQAIVTVLTNSQTFKKKQDYIKKIFCFKKSERAFLTLIS